MKRFKSAVAVLVTAVMLFGVIPPQQAEAAGLFDKFKDWLKGETATVTDGKAMADLYGLPYSGMENDKPITIRYFVADSAQTVSKDNPFNKAMEAITNIKVDVEYLVGDAQEKYGVMIASGDLPDLVNVGVGEQGRFINSGSYIPLQDLAAQYAPDYLKTFEKWWKGMKYSDGNVYVLSIWSAPIGTQNPVTYNGSAFWIQKDVLDYFGRAPKTIDEFFDFIHQYKAKFPTIDGVPTIGFEVEMSDGWRYWPLLNATKSLAGYANWGDFAVADTTKNVAIDCFSQSWSKPYIKKLNEEYLLGTIPKESLTRDRDQHLASKATGAVLGFYDQQWSFQNAEQLLMQEGKFNRTYLPLGLTYDDSIAPNYIENGTFAPNNGFGITKNCKNPERVLKLVNYVINEDVQTFLSWGIEGQHYYVRDGRYLRPDDQRAKQVNDPQWVRDNMGRWYRNLFPKIDGSYSNGNAAGPDTQPEEYYASLNEYDKDLFKKLGIETRIDFMGDPVDQPPYYPFWSMTWTSSGNAADQARSRLVETAVKYLSQLVVAPKGKFDSLWNEYQRELKKINTKPMFDQINSEIKYWMDLFAE